MQFYLIDNRLDLSVGPKIKEHDGGAVADSDALDQSLLDKLLEGGPNLVQGSVHDLRCLSACLKLRHHPVNKIQVDVVKLKLAQAPPQSALDIILFLLMHLRCDENIFSLDALSEAFL